MQKQHYYVEERDGKFCVISKLGKKEKIHIVRRARQTAEEDAVWCNKAISNWKK